MVRSPHILDIDEPNQVSPMGMVITWGSWVLQEILQERDHVEESKTDPWASKSLKVQSTTTRVYPLLRWSPKSSNWTTPGPSKRCL